MPRFSPTLAVVAACALWALGTILSKDVLETIPPITVLVLQLVPSVIVLWIIAIRSGAELPRGRLLLAVGMLGLLNPGWSYTLNIFGLQRSTASVATLLWAAEPIMILCLATLFLKERLNGMLVLLVGCATLGVLVVSGLAGDLGGVKLDDGALLILSGVFLCAVFAIVARGQQVGPLAAVTIQQSVALLWTLAIWPLELGTALTGTPALTAEDMAKATVSGLLYYGAAYWLYLYALRRMPASVVGSFFSLIPLFGVVGAYFFLGERMTSMQWLGAAIIFVSVAILLWRLARSEHRETLAIRMSQ